MKKKLLAALVGTTLLLAACGGGKESKPADTTTGTGNNETVTVDAEKIVNSKCIACHGNNLEGQGNFPALADVGARLSKDEILAVINDGKGTMPPKIISGADAEAVAEWLANKK